MIQKTEVVVTVDFHRQLNFLFSRYIEDEFTKFEDGPLNRKKESVKWRHIETLHPIYSG